MQRGIDSMSEALIEAVTRPSTKRKTIAAACAGCRDKKTKCDGLRPCRSCQRAKTECSYTTVGSETPREALKRNYDTAFQDRDRVQKLFNLIATAREDVAWQLFAGIRGGQSVSQLLTQYQGLPSVDDFYQNIVRNMFFTNLAQSTASMRDLATLATQIFGSNYELVLPTGAAFRMLRDSIVTIEKLSKLIEDDGAAHRLDTLPRIPTVWVPASPWTSLLTSDLDMSHFISLFLAFLNHYWRYVEDDIFIAAMQSKDVNSPYCTPFLVNSILALTSLYTEHDKAFSAPGYHMLTRGEHFYDEAQRLWDESDQAATVCNIQGLLILVFTNSMRGKDKLGLPLLRAAFDLHCALSLPEVQDRDSLEDISARVRYGVAHALALVDSLRNQSLGQACLLETGQLESFTSFLEVLPSTNSSWTPYPLSDLIVSHARLVLMTYRYQLLHHAYEFEALQQHAEPCSEGWMITAIAMLASFDTWYQNLPAPMTDVEHMTSGHLEFHCHAHIILLLACNAVERRVSDECSDNVTLHNQRATIDTYATRYARYTGRATRIARETWGLKVVPGPRLQAAALASVRLLRNLHSSTSRRHAAPLVDPNYLSAPLLKTMPALEECLRTLLAGGAQQALYRAVVQMIYVSAGKTRQHLLPATQRMFATAAAHWKQEELDRLESAYPILTPAGEAWPNVSLVQLAKQFGSSTIGERSDEKQPSESDDREARLMDGSACSA